MIYIKIHWFSNQCIFFFYSFFEFLIQFFPSTILVTSILLAESPTTLSVVAGGSIIVAITVNIGRVASGKPSEVIINVSDIVPPPIGTAVTNIVAIRAVVIISNDETFELNR